MRGRIEERYEGIFSLGNFQRALSDIWGVVNQVFLGPPLQVEWRWFGRERLRR
jgi:hypothetical protein